MRRKLQEVRKEFEELFNELETAETNFVSWKKGALGLPLISREPKALNSVKEQTKSGRKENEGDFKQSSGSVEDEFDVKRSENCKTVLNTEDGERVDGEKNAFDEELVLESPASGASNSESHTNRSALQVNQAFCLENNRASIHLLQEHRPPEKTILPEEQSSEKQRFLILNSEMTSQRDFTDDERYSHRVLDSPLPLNSTLKPESGDEQERRESVTHDSTSETSLQSYLQGRPHLREQARLSDTWLTDRSFGKWSEGINTVLTCKFIYQSILKVPIPPPPLPGKIPRHFTF